MHIDDSTNPSQSDDTDTKTTDPDSTTADKPTLIAEFTVSADAFVLAETLQATPETVVELEKIVPVADDLIPYLWSTDTDMEAFKQAAATDPTVGALTCVATFDDGALYRVHWSDSRHSLLGWLRECEAVLLQAEANNEGQANRWLLKLRLDSRQDLADLQDYCDDHDISFQLVRLYELTDPKIGQYDVSKKQRELLIVGLEMGLFEIPREATLEEVAEKLGISSKAASERLRRGQTNLVSNTLTIGQPAGVGID